MSTTCIIAVAVGMILCTSSCQIENRMPVEPQADRALSLSVTPDTLARSDPRSPDATEVTVTIEFNLPADSFVRMGLYDASGVLVVLLVNQYLEAGWILVDIDASNLSSGCYTIQLVVGDRLSARRLLLVK